MNMFFVLLRSCRVQVNIIKQTTVYRQRQFHFDSLSTDKGTNENCWTSEPTTLHQQRQRRKSWEEQVSTPTLQKPTTIRSLSETSTKKTSKWFLSLRTSFCRLKSWLNKIVHRLSVRSIERRVLSATSVELRVLWRFDSTSRFSTEIFSSRCVPKTRFVISIEFLKLYSFNFS